MPQLSRRKVVAGASGLAVFGITLPVRAQPATEWMPLQDPGIVKELVTVAHSDAKRVLELVERQPALANAAIDWGFGDWEDGLGAAAHTGRREVAEVLLAHGARMSIFAAAMLGQLDVVKTFVDARPGVQRTHGPHGIPLLAHAQAGGPGSEAVTAYLKSLGDAGTQTPPVSLEKADRDALSGRYLFGPGPRDLFDIDVRNDRLNIERPGVSRRQLNHIGALVFFPSGAPAVKITFTRETGPATEFTIADPVVVVRAKRQ